MEQKINTFLKFPMTDASISDEVLVYIYEIDYANNLYKIIDLTINSVAKLTEEAVKFTKHVEIKATSVLRKRAVVALFGGPNEQV